MPHRIHWNNGQIPTKRPMRLVLSFACLFILPGCSGTDRRQALEGTVTVDGAPLSDGSITLIPQGDTKSPTCGGKISDGRFSIEPKGGAAPGTFRVEITASRNTSRKVENPRDGSMIDEIVQYIPPKYNRQSELTATVSDQGKNRFEFALTSGSAQ